MGAERTFIAISDQARQAEQDAFELHQALAEAVRRLHRMNDLYCNHPWQAETADLMQVLDRTSRRGTGTADTAEAFNRRQGWAW